MVAVLAVGCISMLAGCGSAGPEHPKAAAPTTLPLDAPADNPLDLQRVKVRIVAADGSIVERCLLLADSDVLRMRGLMGVDDPTLGGTDGMLFVFEADVANGFWMKDTLLPLSIAFAAADGTVTGTADMDPCPASTPDCPVYRPEGSYRMAVEVVRGRLADLGLVAGARIERGDGPACGDGRD